mgnify:CR=1 FL=1
MRIRVKLTLLLLAASLTPLIVLRALDDRALSGLSARVVDRSTETLTRRVAQELSLQVRGVADRLASRMQTVTLIVRTQAEALEQRLHTPPGAPPHPPLTGRDFDERPDAIPGMREQPGWRPGEVAPPRVSYEEPVFVPAPGVGFDDPGVASRAAALRDAVGILGALSAEHRELVRSQFFCSVEGLHMAFPGKGGYPAGYDGRDRPWYLAAASERRLVWTGPVRDAPTGELRMTCSAPVFAPDGTLAGVTAADVSISEVLELIELPPELALGAEAMLLRVDGDPVRVVLSKTSAGSTAPDSPPALPQADPEAAARLKRDLLAGLGGSLLMDLRGVPSLWVYHPVRGPLGVVTVVPLDRVDALVEPVRQDLRSMAQESFRKAAAGSALVVVACLVAAYLAGRTLSRPIRRLADAAEAIGAGDLTARAGVGPRRDEIGKLARAFNAMVPALADRLRLRESVALANELQQGLLPQQSPEMEGYDLHGLAVYCDETGGDYFDYLTPVRLGEGRYGLVIGDVTGHGIPSALIMTSVRALLQSHARRCPDPGELLTIINAEVSRDATQGRFITLALVEVEAAGGALRIASAGHDPALLVRAGDGSIDQTPVGGLPIGVSPDERYESADAGRLGPGDLLFLGTDGIWECRDPGGRLYGKERLRELLRRHATGSAREIGDALVADLDAYRAGGPRLDDVTFVILKRNA